MVGTVRAEACNDFAVVEMLSRREFLKVSAAGCAAGLACDFASGQTTQQGVLRVKLVEADGSPLDASRLQTFHARDLFNDPLPLEIDRAGTIRSCLCSSGC